MARKKKAGWRRLAALRLDDLRRLSAAQRANGEILDPDSWLVVLANTLASAPEGPVTSRRGPDAPAVWRLAYENLAVEAARCRLEATQEQIERALRQTLERRSEAEAGRAKRLLPFSGDEIARRLGVTAAVRREAEAWSIGATDETSAQRKEAQRKKDRLGKQALRREAGALPRADYEAQSLSAAKPWEALGICRRTWERHRQGADVASPSVASPSAAINLSQVRLSQVRRQPLACGVASPSAANKDYNGPAAVAARGKSGKRTRDTKGADRLSGGETKAPAFERRSGNRKGEEVAQRHAPDGLGVRAAALVKPPSSVASGKSLRRAIPQSGHRALRSARGRNRSL